MVVVLSIKIGYFSVRHLCPPEWLVQAARQVRESGHKGAAAMNSPAKRWSRVSRQYRNRVLAAFTKAEIDRLWIGGPHLPSVGRCEVIQPAYI
jgi:hypothetical protein